MDDQTRNLNPTIEARCAMMIWSGEYAAQGGGSMDFWRNLSEARKRQCKESADKIRAQAIQPLASKIRDILRHGGTVPDEKLQDIKILVTTPPKGPADAR